MLVQYNPLLFSIIVFKSSIELKKNTVYKGISLFIKLSIVIASLFYIYYKIFCRNDISEIVNSFKDSIHLASVRLYLFMAFLLVFFNWGIESLKWKFLIRKLEEISFWNAYKSVLAGVTVSIFTPNRIGEFGGRIFLLEKADKIKAILVNFMGGLSQLVITVVIGLLSLLIYIIIYYSATSFYYSSMAMILIAIAFSLFFYFRLSFFKNIFSQQKYFKRWKIEMDTFDLYSTSELFLILGFSFLRYCVFSFQFYLLLLFFGVNVSFFIGVMMIAITFLVVTVIPTIALTELGVRGAAAIALIGIFSNNTIGIVSASLTLWILNVVFPALVGVVFVFKMKFFKTSTE